MALLLVKENNCALLFWNPCTNVEVMALTSTVYDNFIIWPYTLQNTHIHLTKVVTDMSRFTASRLYKKKNTSSSGVLFHEMLMLGQCDNLPWDIILGLSFLGRLPNPLLLEARLPSSSTDPTLTSDPSSPSPGIKNDDWVILKIKHSGSGCLKHC